MRQPWGSYGIERRSGNDEGVGQQTGDLRLVREKYYIMYDMMSIAAGSGRLAKTFSPFQHDITNWKLK